ncbi:MAG: toxin-antitoxin system YwqK family antitoxin [Bacteroidales bacterium]
MSSRYFLLVGLMMLPLLAMSQNMTDSKGMKQGPWIKNYPNGEVMYEGTFKNDIPVGVFRRYNNEGILISELTYSDKKKDEAVAIFFYADGLKAGEGMYIERKKEGLWKIWSATRPLYLISEEYYHLDLRHGLSQKFYPDSSLAEKMTWDSGNGTGEWFQYYPDGSICLRAEYQAGSLEGPFSYYHPNGKLQYEGRYKENVRAGDWMVFNEDGSLKQIIVYKEGKPADPKLAEQETKFLDDLEKNRGRVEIKDINGTIIQ